MTDYEDQYFKPGEILFDTGAPLTHAFFIIEGTVEIEIDLGDKKLSMTVGKGNFVGDIAVAVTQKADFDALCYKGKATALEPVKATIIPVSDIKQELDDCPPLIRAWFASFVSRVLHVVEDLSKDK
jgi:CRP-like cAMP-binding protein